MVIPGHSTPWRAFADAYFARSRVTVWKASRGFGGKSYLLALLGLTEALTLKANVKILGGSGAQSQNVQDYISKELYEKDNAPTHLWQGEPLTTVSRFVWGNSIQALMASTKSTRGPHPERMRMDEIDEMAVLILDAAMGQAMSRTEGRRVIIPAQTVLSSTHHYPDATMTEVLKRAQDRGWPIHEWSYHETSTSDGWLLPSEIRAKRNEVTTRQWETEYDLQEPSSENRAIWTEYVEQMFQASLGTYDGALGQYVEIEEPQRGARYATGADWAKDQDWTVIVTLRTDVEPWRVVAWERRGREPWPAMVKRFNQRVNRYRGKAAHDKTGVGNVVDDYLTVDARGYKMVGAVRQNLFSEYIMMIEQGGVVSPEIEFCRNEHVYCTRDDLYGRGHPPDSVVAGAMAVRAAKQGGWGRGA